jgi:hypothetical protein
MILAKLFGGSRSQEYKGAKIWKQLEKKGKNAEAKNAFPEAKQLPRCQ